MHRQTYKSILDDTEEEEKKKSPRKLKRYADRDKSFRPESPVLNNNLRIKPPPPPSHLSTAFSQEPIFAKSKPRGSLSELYSLPDEEKESLTSETL